MDIAQTDVFTRKALDELQASMMDDDSINSSRRPLEMMLGAALEFIRSRATLLKFDDHAKGVELVNERADSLQELIDESSANRSIVKFDGEECVIYDEFDTSSVTWIEPEPA